MAQADNSNIGVSANRSVRLMSFRKHRGIFQLQRQVEVFQVKENLPRDTSDQVLVSAHRQLISRNKILARQIVGKSPNRTALYFFP